MFSSSCPNTTYVDTATTKSWALSPLTEAEEVDDRPRQDADLGKLSQSPTIFSLLQRSLPTHAGVPFRGEKTFVPSSRTMSTPSPTAPDAMEMKREASPADDTEDIMFPMSMDGEADAVLADATQSYLSLDH